MQFHATKKPSGVAPATNYTALFARSAPTKLYRSVGGRERADEKWKWVG